MQLREYQQRTIDHLYRWFEAGHTGHPCIELPTGSGKSHIVAALCKDALTRWAETRILMLTHVKELIEQNAGKMLAHWPNAPLGIYSAGMRRRDLGEPITFAGIQSVSDKSDQIGHIDLVLIDECHLVSHKQEGRYRSLIVELMHTNPALRVIGLTATPYRLGHGYITDAPALFADIIAPVSIEELIHKGFLAPLRSKLTNHKLSVEGVHRRGGEYIESELQAAVNTEKNNAGTVDEVIRLAGDRRSWLFFCTGVRHAHNVADILTARGITAASDCHAAANAIDRAVCADGRSRDAAQEPHRPLLGVGLRGGGANAWSDYGRQPEKAVRRRHRRAPRQDMRCLQ